MADGGIERRIDLVMRCGPLMRPVYVDITFINDSATRKIDHAASEKKRIAEKSLKYAALAEADGAKLVTAVFFTNGGIGKQTRDLLTTLAQGYNAEKPSVVIARVARRAAYHAGFLAMKANARIASGGKNPIL